MLDRRREPLISYAQHGEDVVLLRAFAGQQSGRYVDVGAFDPTIDSVTRLFYERGWRGLNIEPTPGAAIRFHEQRPEDVNVAAAAGAHDGTTVLYMTDVPGWSSTDPAAADVLRQRGHVTGEVTVPVRRLSSLLDELPPAPIDFLKIDVEGAELAVVQGLDLERHRPRVVVLEAVAPGAPQDHETPAMALLVDAGYQRACFDGLNHFLTCEPDLVPALHAPANPTDEFVKHSVRVLEDRAEHLAADAEQAAWLRGERQDLLRQLEERETLLQQVERELAKALRQRDASHAKHVRSEQELALMRASSSWRLTAPLRAVRDRRAAAAWADRTLRRWPWLRNALITVVVRFPRVATALQSALDGSSGPGHSGPSHDTVGERRSRALAALEERARRRGALS